MVKQKTNKMLAVMLVLAVMLTSLIAGAMLLAPKTSEVNAAGSSATLSQDWRSRLSSTSLSNGSYYLINSITITTTASKIDGFTKSVNVSENGTDDLYCYYKEAIKEYHSTTVYDVVFYGAVDTIFAPVDCSSLFVGGAGVLRALKSIVFDNFDTSNVTNMSYMFGFLTLKNLDISGFDMSNVTNTTSMFESLSSLKYLYLPKTIGNTVITGLPFTLYVDGAGEAVTQIDSSIQGKILTEFGVTPVYPTPEAPSTPAGVDLIDIVIMGTLTLTLIIVCVAVLTINKKRKLTNRNVTIENAKKIINK